MSPLRSRRSATLLAAFLGWSLPLACGKSDSREGTAPAATGGDGATGGTGGSAAQGGTSGTSDGCTYNGKHYENGETFGSCDECICAEGGIFCTNVDCMPGTGGNGGTSGASVGGAGSGAGGTQGGMGGTSETGGTGLVGDGGTLISPVAGMGGTAGSGATAGMDSAGGEGGIPGEECQSELFTKFCVLGVPNGDLMKLDEGVDISIAMYPAGCSCTRLTDVTCSPLNGTRDVMVSPWVCSAPEGDDCTQQCSEEQIATCSVWTNLDAGTWKVSIPRTGLEVTFQVPSEVPADRLCAKVM
jgi:hypothetical protein